MSTFTPSHKRRNSGKFIYLGQNAFGASHYVKQRWQGKKLVKTTLLIFKTANGGHRQFLQTAGQASIIRERAGSC